MIGRLPDVQVGKSVLADMPEKQAQAMMSKMDELIAAMKALAAKLDADAGVTDTDYSASITDALKVIDLHL